MNCIQKFTFFTILLFFFGNLYSQEDKPKVALVLSGGGAKGIAHVAVLKKLDSLGIVPDLIVGTSMGSVVGGLYAIGYSADSIKKLTDATDWDRLLFGDVSLQDVSVEEKSEFQRYLMGYDIVGGKPKLKPSILKDQNLREYLISLTSPVYGVKSFDEYSIPFRAVTTDLVNGTEVVLSENSLALAIRASMSIPGIFAPVRYKNTLLVDGGVLNNFPVDIAKEMEADIIIGSDVGGGLIPIEKLDSPTTILFQTSMLTSNLKNQSDRELCDILIDHTGNLTYATKDFNKANAIYQQGTVAVNEKVDELVILVEKLKKYPQRPHQLPSGDGKVTIDSISYENISEGNLAVMRARMGLGQGSAYTAEEIRKAVDYAIGTQLFHQIDYKITPVEDRNFLYISGVEKAHHQIEGALHYDTNQGVGIVLNYTGRNVIGNSSRMLLSVDAAEQPKFRVQYQQNFGKNKKWWWRGQVFGQNTEQSFYSLGVKGEDLKNDYLVTSLQFNKSIKTLKDYIGMELNYEYTLFRPELDPETNVNIYDLKRYSFKNLELSGYYVHNSLDKVFFATKGSYLFAQAARSLSANVNTEFNEFPEDDVDGHVNKFTKVSMEYEKRFALKNANSLILGSNVGFTFIDNQDADDISFIRHGQGAKYFLGGNLRQNRRDSYAFKGLGDGQLMATQFISAHASLQLNPFRNFYITPHANFASVGFVDANSFFDEIFDFTNEWTETSNTSLLFSSGATISYDTILGPTSFDISYINDLGKLQFFFGVGLQLNLAK
ncbi:patatin-like phospholipase family protein [Galbibacter mesophilus]|uniref:patatin-like phospholipase family protein n=1 Tax=Galbibacter mesophilus TaxID=379069 RepID=UPI00191FE2B3|nr:patatin-like phospholipase family protein [Galbibacter mesophilus]MCM5662634.1 patatin-like phospholipase family protein [Galbibacter mesophilus]